MFNQLKAICATVLFFFPFRLYADTDSLGLPNVKGKIKWEISESVPGKNRVQLFSAAQKWLMTTYNQQMYSVVVNDPLSCMLSGELVTGSLRRPQRRVAYTITCENHKYILEIEQVATYIGGTRKLLGSEKGWVDIQGGFDYYMKRRAAGKNVKSYEGAYHSLRSHIYDKIIKPLKHLMQE